MAPFQALAAMLAMVSAAAASAATGMAFLPSQAGEPVTVLYPTQAVPAPLQRGPFTLQVAVDAAPAGGNGRLVVLSHGSGGSVWPHFDLGQALVAAGFTVAMPLHAGDNFKDSSDAGPVSWERRPQEVSQAIDTVAGQARPGGRLAPLQLDLQRVGAYGMSAGGITVLALAGARWSPARFAQHCKVHMAEDFPACVGLAAELSGGASDGVKIAVARRVIGARFGSDSAWRSWQEPRIAAVVASVPVAAPIDMDSLAVPRVPLGLVRAGQDAWLAPRWHSDAVLAACGAHCTLVADMAQAGHGSILSPMVTELSGREARLLRDPPGFDRGTLAQVHAAITAFFVKNLGTAASRSP